MENVVEGRFPRHGAIGGAEPRAVAPGDATADPADETPVASDGDTAADGGDAAADDSAVDWPTRESRPSGGAAWA